MPSTTIDSTDGGSAPSVRASEILRKAAELFEHSGYAATTITDIASAAGVLPGSLYHHFPSKEAIAVAILGELDADLSAAVTSASVAIAGMSDPEERVRFLATEMTTLSVRNSAAMRLHAYEAPSVATERLRSALQAQSPSVARTWRKAATGLPLGDHAHPADLELLSYALRHLTLTAAINLGDVDPARAAGQMCDLLLTGVASDCPPDADLDASAAMRAARDAVAGWPAARTDSGTGTRDDIIAAARGEFARRGYEATTIRDVAQAAQVHMGTLYRRIGSKEELLEEIIGGYGERLDAALRATMTSGSSAPETLDAMAVVFGVAKRRFREESEIVKLGARSRETGRNPIGAYFEQTRERLRLLEGILEAGIADGSLRPVAPVGELAMHLRAIFWLPYGNHRRTSATRAHQFLRSSLLRGLTRG